MTQTDIDAAGQLATLLGFLETDPDNPNLLFDALTAALKAGDLEKAATLGDRLDALAKADEAARNFAGMAALQRQDYAGGAEHFRTLLETHPDDPNIAYNLAWALAMSGDNAAAREILTEEMIAALPQAATLDVQLRHAAREYEEAATRARFYADQHGNDPALSAAISVLALDIEDRALARDMAQRGGDHPDALTTRAMLALDEQDIGEAMSLIEASLARNDRSPRAWLASGTAHMMKGSPEGAIAALDHAADLFGTHLGSWIAAGWAHLMAGNAEIAKARFNHAMALDDTFADCHGSLAVIALLEGDTDTGQRLMTTAQRLDRNSFSAAFAAMLMQAGTGDADGAKAVFEQALNAPINSNGDTLAMALARMGMGAG